MCLHAKRLGGFMSSEWYSASWTQDLQDVSIADEQRQQNLLRCLVTSLQCIELGSYFGKEKEEKNHPALPSGPLYISLSALSD